MLLCFDVVYTIYSKVKEESKIINFFKEHYLIANSNIICVLYLY